MKDGSSGLSGFYYHIWKCSVPCESFRRGLQNWKLTSAFHPLSSIPLIGIFKKRCARYECHVKWSSGAICPTWMFDSNPNCRPNSQEVLNLLATLQPSSLPQNGQASLKAAQLFEKDVPSLSLWSKALGDDLSLLCLRCQIIFRVRLSLTHDRCRIPIMTPTRAITPTILPLNFSWPWPWQSTFHPEKSVDRWALLTD